VAVDLARYIVSLEAQTATYVRELDKANNKLDRFHKDQERAVAKIKTAFLSIGATFAAAFSVRAIVNFTASAIQAADAIGESARAAGFSAERFQRLQFVFKQNGLEAGEFESAMRALNTRLGQFINTGAGPAAKAIEQLGLKQRIVSGEIRTSEQFFDAATKALDGVGNAAQRAALQGALFGKEIGPKMTATLDMGTAALNAAADAAKGVLSDETIRKGGLLADAWDRIAAAVGSYAKSLAVAASYDAARLFGVDEVAANRLQDQLAALEARRDRMTREEFANVGELRSRAEITAEIDLIKAQIEYQRLLKTPFIPVMPTGYEETEFITDDELIKLETFIFDLNQKPPMITEEELIALETFIYELNEKPPFITQEELLALETFIYELNQKPPMITLEEEVALETFIYEMNHGLDGLSQKAREVALTLGENFRDAFADWMIGADRDFGDLLKRMAAQMVTSALFKGLASMFKGKTTGVAGFFASFFGGLEPRADGGPVSAGRGYLVGERGPELFFPGQSGMIAAGGGGDINIYQTNSFNGGDPREMSAAIAANNAKLKNEIKSEILYRQRRGQWG